MEFKNNTQKLEYIRSKIHNDNYANDNYETVCAYIKMIHILIKTKIEGKKENYRVIMCPPKNQELMLTSFVPIKNIMMLRCKSNQAVF